MSDFPLRGGAKGFSSGVGVTSQGILITANTSANTLGSIVELIASTESSASTIIVSYNFMTNPGGNSFEIMTDIMIGGAGSEEILVEGIFMKCDNLDDDTSQNTWTFPLQVPSGSRISARCQSNTAGLDTVSLSCYLVAQSLGSALGYGQCISEGLNKSDTTGTGIDAGGSANTKGSYSEIISSSAGFAGFTLSFGTESNGAISKGHFMVDIAVGSAGNEEIILEDVHVWHVDNERTAVNSAFWGIQIAAGERIAARCQSTITQATDRIISVILHGVR